MPEVINIPLREDEAALVNEAARAARLSVVQWCKVAIIKTAKPPPPAKPAA